MGVDIETTQRELLIRIAEKQDRMNIDLMEIKKSVNNLDENHDSFRLEYIEKHERVVNNANLAHKRIDDINTWRVDMDKRREAVEKALEAQRVMNGVMIFIGTVIGSAAIMYIWNIVIK